VEAEKTLTQVKSVLGRTGCVRGAVFEHDFRLGQVASQGGPCPEKDQGGVRNLPIDDQFGVGQQLLGGVVRQLWFVRFTGPACLKVRDGVRVQVGQLSLRNSS